MGNAIDQMALIDLLTNLRNQSPPPISPDAADGSGMGTLADLFTRGAEAQPPIDQEAALVEQAYGVRQPDLYPEGPPVSRGREIGGGIAAAIGDALATYGGAIGRFPVNANASQQLLERIRQGRMAREKNVNLKKSAEDEAARAKAQYKLGEIKRAEDRGRQDKIRAEDLAARDAERREDREFRAGEAQKAREFELQTIQRSETLRREMEKLRADTDLKQERIRKEGKDEVDKVAARQEAQAQRETTTQGIQYVVGTANNLGALLQEPGATAEGVRKKAKRALDALGVRGPAREEVWRYWMEEVEPDLQAWEQRNAPVQGPQDNPDIGAGIGRALQSPALRFAERR